MHAGGASVLKGMRHHHRRLNPFQPVRRERQRAEHRGRHSERVNGRTDVVDKTGQRQLRRAATAADRIGRFKDDDLAAGLCDLDGGGKAIRTGAHNDGIGLRHASSIAGSPPRMPSLVPDVVVLGPEWPTRALLRAQLIEEGYEVVATDAWPIPRQYLRSGMKPRAVVVDLHGLPDPRSVLNELRLVIEPDSVLVLAALGTMSPNEIRVLGFHVMTRPARVGDIVAAVAKMLGHAQP